MLLDTPQTRLLELNLFTKNIAKFTAVALYFDAEPKKFFEKIQNYAHVPLCRFEKYYAIFRVSVSKYHN